MTGKERGFTFLEMLLVLTIAVMLASLSLFNFLPLHEDQKLEHFIEQLREDTLFMQQAAISTNRAYQMYMYTDDHCYFIRETGSMKRVLTRVYDSGIRVDLGTAPSPLVYGMDGNINKGGTMHVSYGEEAYDIVFHLGQGRFNTIPK